ncbi:MAG: hypothetical protein ACKOB0_05860, partial [Chthoniobacterales bacterium]
MPAKQKILVADPDPDFLDWARTQLAADDVAVITAENIRKASSEVSAVMTATSSAASWVRAQSRKSGSGSATRIFCLAGMRTF